MNKCINKKTGIEYLYYEVDAKYIGLRTKEDKPYGIVQSSIFVKNYETIED